MAHELTQRQDGTYEFASLKSLREEVWHKLGNYLDEGSSIEEWKKAAGMDWQINDSPVQFQSAEGEMLVQDDIKVLYRSDNKFRLGVVGQAYNAVQPGEVLEFFRDLTEVNDMKLSAAGTLFGGKRYWAIADLGLDAQVVDGDKITGHLLLTSSADGSLATTAKFTSTRVVCNNTLTVAMGEKSLRNVIKVSHARKFDAKEVKVDLGLLHSTWGGFIENLKTLSNKKMEDDAAKMFFAKLIAPKEFDIDNTDLLLAQRSVDQLMSLFKTGTGAEMSAGTRWGALNAVTELYTHGGQRKRDASNQFNDSELGDWATMKSKALTQLLTMA